MGHSCWNSTTLARIAQDSKPMELDRIDTMILAGLTANARASQVELASRAGLSSDRGCTAAEGPGKTAD